MKPILAAVVFLLVSPFLILGGYLCYRGGRDLVRSIASESWPASRGMVNIAGKSMHYTVDGRGYRTSILRFGHALPASDAATAELQRLRYPEGKEVTIFYDPRDPSVGVIQPGLHAEAFGLVGAGLACILPALLFLFIGSTMLRASTAGDLLMPGVAGFLGALACALGILAISVGVQRLWLASASQKWPTVPGIVVFQDTPESQRFVYRYEVNGAVHFGEAEAPAGMLEKKGAGVTVSYSPTDPDSAVIRAVGANFLVMPALGAVLLLFGSAIFIWIVPGMRRVRSF